MRRKLTITVEGDFNLPKGSEFDLKLEVDIQPSPMEPTLTAYEWNAMRSCLITSLKMIKEFVQLTPEQDKLNEL